MFCPVCESEYEPGITHCPDDNSSLVERLTPENTLHDTSEARFVSASQTGFAGRGGDGQRYSHAERNSLGGEVGRR